MNVLILGGAGYVGSVLCPKLRMAGHRVSVLDTFWFGDTLPPQIQKFRGDVCNPKDIRSALADQDAVIHLACISNDPSSELRPSLTRAINRDSFAPMLDELERAKIKRFIFASSSSVYGVQNGSVHELRDCAPITAYSRYKLECEQILRARDPQFTWTIVRPATVCGWSPRMRFDLVVNAMTRAALRDRRIPVHGGPQLRPNLHIEDMCSAYQALLLAPRKLIHGEVFNVGAVNASLAQIAVRVHNGLKLEVEITSEPSVDKRSYHIDSRKFRDRLDWDPVHSVEDAANDIRSATNLGMNFNFDETRFFNVQRMKELFP